MRPIISAWYASVCTSSGKHDIILNLNVDFLAAQTDDDQQDRCYCCCSKEFVIFVATNRTRVHRYYPEEGLTLCPK